LSLFEALILGLVQGITEFLPISSSAHVQIFQQLLGLSQLSKPELTAFIATIQLGTEAAVLLFFFKDIVRIASSWLQQFSLSPSKSKSARSSADAKLGWLIIAGTLPVVVIGLLFKDQIENQLRSLWVISATLIIFGLFLGLADWIGKKTKTLEQLTVRNGLLFGMGQALAVIPGVSRSGGTITVGLLLGYRRDVAARYSFLLAIPAVIASGLFEFAASYQDLNASNLLAMVAATAVAFVSGYAVIALFLRYLTRGSFLPFVLYRVGLGSLLLVLLSTGVVQA
jgi:undecaprenyl-diphosphatase